MTTPCRTQTLIQTPWHMDDYLCRAGWHLLRRKRWTVTTAPAPPSQQVVSCPAIWWNATSSRYDACQDAICKVKEEVDWTQECS